MNTPGNNDPNKPDSNKPDPNKPDPEQQDLKTLRKRYEELKNRKIRAETEKASAERRLEELQQRARKLYGTDDLSELRTKLADMKADNERRRRDYQLHLDDIETKLREVEQAYAEANTPSNS